MTAGSHGGHGFQWGAPHLDSPRSATPPVRSDARSPRSSTPRSRKVTPCQKQGSTGGRTPPRSVSALVGRPANRRLPEPPAASASWKVAPQQTPHPASRSPTGRCKTKAAAASVRKFTDPNIELERAQNALRANLSGGSLSTRRLRGDFRESGRSPSLANPEKEPVHISPGTRGWTFTGHAGACSSRSAFHGHVTNPGSSRSTNSGQGEEATSQHSESRAPSNSNQLTQVRSMLHAHLDARAAAKKATEPGKPTETFASSAAPVMGARVFHHVSSPLHPAGSKGGSDTTYKDVQQPRGGAATGSVAPSASARPPRGHEACASSVRCSKLEGGSYEPEVSFDRQDSFQQASSCRNAFKASYGYKPLAPAPSRQQALEKTEQVSTDFSRIPPLPLERLLHSKEVEKGACSDQLQEMISKNAKPFSPSCVAKFDYESRLLRDNAFRINDVETLHRDRLSSGRNHYSPQRQLDVSVSPSKLADSWLLSRTSSSRTTETDVLSCSSSGSLQQLEGSLTSARVAPKTSRMSSPTPQSLRSKIMSGDGSNRQPTPSSFARMRVSGVPQTAGSDEYRVASHPSATIESTRVSGCLGLQGETLAATDSCGSSVSFCLRACPDHAVGSSPRFAGETVPEPPQHRGVALGDVSADSIPSTTLSPPLPATVELLRAPDVEDGLWHGDSVGCGGRGDSLAWHSEACPRADAQSPPGRPSTQFGFAAVRLPPPLEEGVEPPTTAMDRRWRPVGMAVKMALREVRKQQRDTIG